jgi:hypothetical protein
MTKLLYDTITTQLLAYPRQDDEPLVGLDPALVVLTLIQQSLPSYDPATHQPQPTETIDLEAGSVTRGWQLVAVPAPPPVPDWDQLRQALRQENGYSAAFAAALQSDAMAGIQLVAALADWQGGGAWQLFLQALLAALAALPAQDAANVATEFLALGNRCHLDPAFLAALEAMLNQGQAQ